MAEFSDLLLAIYRAARELPMEEFQDAALEIIKPVLAFDSCTWAASELSQDGLIVHSAHLYREPLYRLEAYEEVKTQDMVAFAVAANIGKPVNTHAPTVYQGRDNTGIREYARRYRHQNILATGSHDRDTQLLRSIGLYRADADQQYSQHDSNCAMPWCRISWRRSPSTAR